VPKTVSNVPVMYLDQHNAISKVNEWRSGVDRVCNVAQVSIGSTKVTWDCAANGDPSPNSEDIYGRLTPEGNSYLSGGVDFSDVLIVDDLPLLQAAAKQLFAERKLAARRGQLACDFIPWLQNTDVVGITILEDPKQAENYAGDPLQTPGVAGPDPQVLAYQLPMKIIGKVPTADTDMAVYTVEEVLS